MKTGHINWGPYVMKTQMEDRIVKKLLREGKKSKNSYNKNLAGHLDNQFLYPNGKDVRNLLLWLIDQLPKDEGGEGEAIGAGAVLQNKIKTRITVRRNIQSLRARAP